MADDWEARLGQALNAQHDREAWEPVVGAAVTQTAAKLKHAVVAALPAVVAQVEQWLAANQRDLARYGNGGGDVTPNQAAAWKDRDQAVRQFAESVANAGGGGRVAELPYAAEAWLLLWDWTPAQWHALGDRTRPGRELRPGDSFHSVALAIGAKVKLSLSVMQIKHRYRALVEGASQIAHAAVNTTVSNGTIGQF